MENHIQQIASISGEDYQTVLTEMINDRKKELRKLKSEIVQLELIQKKIILKLLNNCIE